MRSGSLLHSLVTAQRRAADLVALRIDGVHATRSFAVDFRRLVTLAPAAPGPRL